MIQDEKQRVIEHSKAAGYADGVMMYATSYCGEIFRRFMLEGSLLELGPAEGVMTDILAPYFDDYSVVDGADFFVNDIVKKHPNIIGYSSLFEDFMPNRRYDNIVLGHVLEHVESPVDILKRCLGWLSEGGRVIAAVPNAKSIHRQAAVRMGILDHEKQLNSTDVLNGHRRVYDMETLKKDFTDAGYAIVSCGGYWLKPLSNGQINEYWNENMIQAFLALGEEYPEIAAEIYVVASR